MDQTDTFNLFLTSQLSMEVVSVSNMELQASSSLTIYFVLSGDLEILHNGQGIYLKKGDIYLINPYDLFGFISNGLNHVLITKIDLGNMYHLSKPMSPIYMKEAYDKISHTLAAVFLEKNSMQKGYEAIIEGYLYRLVGLFKRHIPIATIENPRKNLSDMNEKITEVVDFINLNYKTGLTLDNLSETFFMSKYYLAHSFKEQVGLTVGNYLKEIRLIHSHTLIEKTHLSMSEIANELGFSNVRSFSEGFKYKYGVTPTIYKQELLKNKSNIEKEVTLDELDALKILNEYAGVDGIAQLNKGQVKEIEAEIYPNATHRKVPEKNIFVRLDDVGAVEKLDAIKRLQVAKYVSVTHLFKYIEITKVNGLWKYNNANLLKILYAIEIRGLIPYIQISFKDYEDALQITNEPTLFYDILKDLAYDLEREFSTNELWKIEFRCFYEWEHLGKLCDPVKEIIPRFKGIGKSLVHLPVQPSLEKIDKEDTSIFIIDDLAQVKRYSYESVLDLLTEPRYIDIISENKNVALQSELVDSMKQLEEDPYYSRFTDLVYANQMLWLFLHSIRKETISFEPLSLDGTPLFTYFPKEMSQKLSVLAQNNIRRDMWYAYQFRGKLFKTIVFNNEFCVITKQGSNYRLLAIYPEKEVIENMFTQNISSEQESSMRLKIKFSNLVGTYQTVEQKITPEIKNNLVKRNGSIEGQKLSYDLQRYFDEISQPEITLNKFEVIGDIDFYIKLPIFGICYVELNKIK